MSSVRARLLSVYEEEKSFGVIIGPPGLLVAISLLLLLWAGVSVGSEQRAFSHNRHIPPAASFSDEPQEQLEPQNPLVAIVPTSVFDSQ